MPVAACKLTVFIKSPFGRWHLPLFFGDAICLCLHWFSRFSRLFDTLKIISAVFLTDAPVCAPRGPLLVALYRFENSWLVLPVHCRKMQLCTNQRIRYAIIKFPFPKIREEELLIYAQNEDTIYSLPWLMLSAASCSDPVHSEAFVPVFCPRKSPGWTADR